MKTTYVCRDGIWVEKPPRRPRELIFALDPGVNAGWWSALEEAKLHIDRQIFRAMYQQRWPRETRPGGEPNSKGDPTP